MDSKTSEQTGIRVGVDIGGTFTDIIAFDPGSGVVEIEKVPSTPSTPAEGVINGLEMLFSQTHINPSDITYFSHGSTVSINALIEREGAKTGLLVTEGFRAIQLARHGEKPETDVKNPRYQQPDPLVPQYRVKEVPERIDSEGNVVQPLDEDAARKAITELHEQGVESIAVTLLFSFLNPEHEHKLKELISDISPDCDISLSSRVSPRIREYPRLSTTVVSGYIDPILSDYLTELEEQLGELGINPDSLSMMLSHGGLTTFDAASDHPASTVLSGPAAGVQGALFSAQQTEATNIITMDMGGTSCDIALAPEREPVTSTDKEIDQNPISVPLIDIQAIGAGGGTIATVENERLRVGSESAGADPGPVCYGRGGQQATITDANLVLGRLNPEMNLAGDLAVDDQAAIEVIKSQIAEPLGLSVTQAAAGIIQVVNDKMKKELSLTLTKRGYDPREFSLIVYGGAGPMHAPAIARELSIPRIIVPPRPGINSAVGLLTTDRRRIYERSQVDNIDSAPLSDTFDELVDTAYEELTAAGVSGDDIAYERELELRYAGQSYELTVTVSQDDTCEDIRAEFDEQHRETYGHVSDRQVETMTYRISATIDTPELAPDVLAPSLQNAADNEVGSEKREVFFEDKYMCSDIHHRSQLSEDTTIHGPAVIEQADTTALVEPDSTARVDKHGNLIMEFGGEQS